MKNVSEEFEESKTPDWVIALSITVIIILICLFMSYNSVYNVYGGHIDNRSMINNADKLCEDNKFLSNHGSCNHLNVYCERYWFPVHCYSHVGCFKNENHCFWNLGVE